MAGGQRILTGIGVRALVEAVCKEVDAGGSNLEERIDALVPDHLTKQNAEVLHGTRLLGNEAAHEVRPPSKADLEAALEVAQNLLSNVYVIPKLGSGLPKRKAKQTKALPKAKAKKRSPTPKSQKSKP